MTLFPRLRYCYLLLFIGTLTACQPVDKQKVIHFGLAQAPVTLDPRFATDAASSRINRLLYHALIDFDAQFKPIPDLATWEQLNATTYRFHLGEQGRMFHHGQHLNADDVKATYDFILESRNASPHRGSLINIQQIIVVNADTIDFQLSKPDPLFIGRLGLGIVPAGLIQQQHPFNKQPIGSGEFRFLTWSQNSELHIERIEDKQEIQFLEVKNPTVRALKLRRGELDILQDDLPPELIRWLQQQTGVTVTFGRGTSFAYLGFNLADPTTHNLLIRQAIAYALNRETIIHYMLGDAARLATSILDPQHWAGNPDLEPYPYNPQKARELLQQAGYNAENPLYITYKTSSNPFRIRIATVIQQQLAEVGIIVSLRTYDWGTFYGDIKAGRFQMFSLSWIGIKMPDIFRYAFHSNSLPPNGANRGRLHDTEVDHLIEQAEQTPDLDMQAHYYRQIQTRLHAELPYIPLWYENITLVTRQSITGYHLSPDGNFDSLITTQMMVKPE
ncbi:ABC transporter substrate-binding protein [Beggiatoa leptomitoformis]|uniref:ABC transporter substrate-binding protein n=1 Tax=Beggiatoa leptomitoformis TaxID=288004 RepID=A0A2N9YBU2_9GAMM|nr:ABC transporter substrate-binding protein [Beggiatoa leptomitoformis]ALG66703.1 ABC transporter substrate-binding protein [Beggiatoa leptomitoformis]AUI67967.1 ABC transporter substrate-binding protein [Beggiatoa leptomitoformis]